MSETNRDRFFEVCGPLYTNTTGNVFDSTRIVWNHDVAEHFFDGEERVIDLRPGLAGVVAPCLVLVGADDPATPVSASTEIRDSLTSADVDFRVFDNCGHGTHRDQPEETIAAINQFIDAISRTVTAHSA